ncbi:response regulator [Vibrio sp. SS-MA-C1-2]|uniref:response regulator n=1 Tax=Vibrio sp. SS-MA-C1-2 TaxID=2908646 RepID=UPI001F3E7180|nr:response regulator [Vibrio sp. SS-MA-C1-2]UJF18049.1 response regulator [Vibrio sp. SS-MA-C1-2]
MKKILIAEDNQELREAIVEALLLDNFTITSCESAEQAINYINRDYFDVVILDYIMAGMTGIDAVPVIKHQAPKTAIILITAFGTIDIAVDAMKKGADEFLVKPFSLKELNTTVRKVMTKKQLNQSASQDEDKVFSALANPIRRQAINILKQYRLLKFMDLCRLLNLEDHSKFNFHLRQLIKSDLVSQDEDKNYFLTRQGIDIESRLL